MKKTIMSQDDSYKLMRALDFFREFTNDEIKTLLTKKEIEKYEAGETILSEGGSGSAFYVILKGCVIVTKKIQKSPVVRQLNELVRGCCFGEMSIVTGRNRSASVVAADETFVFKVSSQFLNEDSEDPRILKIKVKMFSAFARELADKLESYNDKAVLLL